MNRLAGVSGNIISPEKKIFIVEDNEVYAKSLQRFLYTRMPDIKEITIFRIGELCLLEMNRNPDIVIMDYYLNSQYEKAQNGIEIVKRIKAMSPTTNIIILSIQKNIDVAIEAIRQYNCLYVQKNKEAFDNTEQFIIKIFNGDNPAFFDKLN